jgi:hypothetical protein
VQGNRFRKTVRLGLGRNRFALKATKAGYQARSQAITIIRQKPLVHVRVSEPVRASLTVRVPSIAVKGRATPGSEVAINGAPAAMAGNRFEITVPLERGRNILWLKARKNGLRTRGIRLVVTRRLSEAEISAELARKRETFMNASTSIPYNQLIKDPDRYTGRKVRYYGEILQIQESGGIGFMLLYVTDLGYDIWSDQIWVNYEGSVRGAEGDKLTVYGTVTGIKSYETQIGARPMSPRSTPSTSSNSGGSALHTAI